MIISTSFNKKKIKQSIISHIVIGIILLIIFSTSFLLVEEKFILYAIVSISGGSLLFIIIYTVGGLIPLYRKNLKDVDISVKGKMITINSPNNLTKIDIDNIKSIRKHKDHTGILGGLVWLPNRGYINPILIELYDDITIIAKSFNNFEIYKSRVIVCDNEYNDLYHYISKYLKKKRSRSI